ncbi:metallophosphoesterase [Desulfobacterales bacterium HSG17]|nr:metallophosphoesterase [Desulfobacterales bacterium HSG17]
MKILSVSDFVDPILYDNFDPEHFKGIDLIFSCGDLPPEYLTFLALKIKVPLFYIKGNHDIRYDTKPPEGCIHIDSRIVEHKGLRIIGFDGSRWYNGNVNQFTEPQMRKKIRKMRLKLWWNKGVDIIITHAPPRYINDAEDLCHRGFKSFLPLIKKYTPPYFLHGHIHMNFTNHLQRITIVNNTKVINTCGYYIFKIDGAEIEK